MPEETNKIEPARNIGLGLLGSVVGGTAGYFLFGWLLQQGFYAVALPGVLLGLGCGLVRKQRSMNLALACGLAGLALGLFAEWKHRPFNLDRSFGYFVAHLHRLQPFTLLMLALGGVGGFWFAWRGRESSPSNRKQAQP
jgi:hypothetical protein